MGMQGMVTVASSPITWPHFQHVMRGMGYEMLKHDPDNGAVVFRLAADAPTEGLKNPVSVMYPDYVSGDGITPAYEKSYVIDLMTQIGGANGGKAILTIIANRRWDG